jgi:hypothetical protein
MSKGARERRLERRRTARTKAAEWNRTVEAIDAVLAACIEAVESDEPTSRIEVEHGLVTVYRDGREIAQVPLSEFSAETLQKHPVLVRCGDR